GIIEVGTKAGYIRPKSDHIWKDGINTVADQNPSEKQTKTGGHNQLRNLAMAAVDPLTNHVLQHANGQNCCDERESVHKRTRRRKGTQQTQGYQGSITAGGHNHEHEQRSVSQ